MQNAHITAWKVTGPGQRHAAVPLGPTGTAQVYVMAQGSGGYGPLAGPITVTP